MNLMHLISNQFYGIHLYYGVGVYYLPEPMTGMKRLEVYCSKLGGWSSLILTFSAGQEMFKVMARPKVMQIWALSIITFYAKKRSGDWKYAQEQTDLFLLTPRRIKFRFFNACSYEDTRTFHGSCYRTYLNVAISYRTEVKDGCNNF